LLTKLPLSISENAPDDSLDITLEQPLASLDNTSAAGDPMQVDTSPSGVHPPSQVPSQDAGSLHSADNIGGVPPPVPGIADDSLGATLEKPPTSLTPMDGDPLTSMQGDTFPSVVHPSSQAPSQDAGSLHPADRNSRVPPAVQGIADDSLGATLERPPASLDNTPMDEDSFVRDLMQVDEFPSNVPPLLPAPSQNAGFQTALDDVPNDDPLDKNNSNDQCMKRTLRSSNEIDLSDEGSRNGDDDSDMDDGVEGSSASQKPNPQPGGKGSFPGTKQRKRRRVQSSPSLDSDEGDGDDVPFSAGTLANPIDVDSYSSSEPTIKEEFVSGVCGFCV
jgi:hypothetical protein